MWERKRKNFEFKTSEFPTPHTFWGAERDPVLEAPLSRKDPRAVSVAQEGSPTVLWPFITTDIIHLHKEVLLIEHLKEI